MPARPAASPARAIGLALAVVAALAGCGSDADRPAPAADGATAGPTAGPTAEVPLLTPEAIAKLLTQAHGRVLVVNVWATWCLPCIHEWPDLDLFARDYRDRDVEVLAISVDDPTMSVKAVRSFVAARKPAFRVVQRADGPADALTRLLDPTWEAVLPTTFVFDRAGRLQTRLQGARTREQLEQAVAPLVGGPRPRTQAP